MISGGQHLIGDYTFAKDALFARINLEGDELALYYHVHEALAEKIPAPRPDSVPARFSTATLMQRIAMRDRPYERQMEADYIDQVNRAYDKAFLDESRRVPVLVLDANQIDFVRHPDDLAWVENRIRQSLLLPPFQPELPISH